MNPDAALFSARSEALANAAAAGIERPVWMFRGFLFYPVAAVATAAIVLLSLGPALTRSDTRAVDGKISRGVLVLEGDDLAHARSAPNIVSFVPRDARWQATGVRVAVRPGAGPADSRGRGLEIVLSPAASAWLGAGPLRVEAATSPLPLTAASQFALGLTRGGRTEWSLRPISPIRDTLVFEFASDASGEVVRSLALRPVSDDPNSNRGVEIRSIRVTRRQAATR
jgi:hypothetical protein